MSKFAKIRLDTSLKISLESTLLQTIRKAHAWYANQKFGTAAAIGLAVIDILGFLQIANLTMPDNIANRIIIISALAVSFEVATLYIGYALSLKSYKLGRPIHNIVLWMSALAFFLGFAANTVYRLMTMDIAYSDNPGLAKPMTILLITLPVITSLMNVVIGCLAFDPLLFDLLRLSRKLRILQIRKRQLKGYIEALSSEDELKEALIETEDLCYNNAKIEIAAMRVRLKTYVAARASTAYSELSLASKRKKFRRGNG